ncbi:hypothetical protein [Microbacterium elymi]|uniref:Uncharacterized protein n=1 Tax=Microbacterium elymi TaxID=2909587 RepID=A0ABY5NN71_9MICO|nr:hypothetical protein [Microbacterium elymi]UUT36649.1 hypothetical protein L2X98_29310 [Microbacterium elymi]
MSWYWEHRTWRSGAWGFELRDDEIADLTFEGRRVLRSIRAVVRDEDWNTPVMVVDAVDDGTPGRLTLRLHSEGFGADLHGTLVVTATGDAFEVELELGAHDEFWTNRAGLVVLHPPQTAGAPLKVVHSDGTVEKTAFPRQISPHQPAFDIAGLHWRDAGADIRLRFGGDVFEMEDQRNWTDASFKTYSRPLALPFPYRLAAGEVINQTLRVRVHETTATSAAVGTDARITLAAGGAFPVLGVGAATAPDPAPAFEAAGMPVLVELDLRTPNWRAALQRATAGATALDVRFVLGADAASLGEGVRALVGLPVVRVSAFQPDGAARHVSDHEATAALREQLAAADVEVAVIGGVRSHFTELNREHARLPEDLDGITFSMTPLFHSPATEQLVEAVAIQRLVAEQAVEIAGGAPVHVGPVTLRPHFNDVATTPPPMADHSDLAAGYGTQLTDADDLRYDAPELAAWTIASFAALAVPGVASVAHFEQWGPRGWLRADGSARPVLAAREALRTLIGTTLLHGNSPDGLVWAVGGVAADGSEAVLVANLDRVERTVPVRTPGRTASLTLAPSSWGRLP